jgi:hypothetical protein
MDQENTNLANVCKDIKTPKNAYFFPINTELENVYFVHIWKNV